jgi:chemotaxis protein methyltransferase CheR
MTLKETIPTVGGWDARILATDIDSNVLNTASSAVYPEERVRGIEKARLRRWFVRGKGKQSGMVRLKPDVRSLIDFGQLNLMENWNLPEPVDVIFCRNVIIYFDKQSKMQLIDRYADVIKDDGYLFIGHSESLFKISDRFELVGNTVYRKKR